MAYMVPIAADFSIEVSEDTTQVALRHCCQPRVQLSPYHGSFTKQAFPLRDYIHPGVLIDDQQINRRLGLKTQAH